MTDEEFIVILVTTATAAEAAQIARTLVEERLIACGNVPSTTRVSTCSSPRPAPRTSCGSRSAFGRCTPTTCRR